MKFSRVKNVLISIYSAILTVAMGMAGPTQEVIEAAAEATNTTKNQLTTTSVEAMQWPATPWPPLDKASHKSSETLVNKLVTSLCPSPETAMGTPAPLRTRFLLVGGQLPRSDLLRVGTTLDRTVQQLHTLMGRSDGEPPFSGRLGLVFLPQRDSFVLALADVFSIYAAPSTAAVLQTDGHCGIIIADARAPRGLLDHQLDRTVTHAYLHALHSPLRLPAWANEGLATAVAWSNAGPGSARGRAEAIAEVRDDVDFKPMLELEYGDGSWSAGERAEARVGLLMERVMRERPKQLRNWILAVKHGEPWRAAFATHFDDTPDALVAWATRYFKVND
jgi:hypothetical protein